MPASRGTFFLVVGASGVGKDTLLDGAFARLAHTGRYKRARRVITRPAGPGEDHEAVSEAEFAARAAAGGFLLSWQAHGLNYGLPIALLDDLARGVNVIANGSRTSVAELHAKVSPLVVIEVTAPRDQLRSRILGRGREDEAQADARVARVVAELPPGINQITIANDGTVEEGIDRMVQAFETATDSRALLRHRLAGGRLTEAEYARLFTDMVAGTYTEAEISAFVQRSMQTLDDDEVIAIARARCGFMPRIDWGAPIVVDKHSLGGVPGSRITLIVVPIVAAHGLLIPKTSSRAITSAAGTADAMEVACRVDLTPAELTEVVRATGGSIAWTGRLNHSPLDDVVNAITRPLGLESNRWSVASIMSKKWSAGSTHVVLDMPYGPGSKLPDLASARELGRVFQLVGEGLGLVVRAIPSEGAHPIGRGIGPALELRDVRMVLSGHAEAPEDLREKALRYAAEILAFDPAIGNTVDGKARAEELLASGAALRRFEAIIDAQGRHAEVQPAELRETIRHEGDACVVRNIDGWILGGIARAAGAPADKSAGVDLHVAVGERIVPGTPLYTIHAAVQSNLTEALVMAREHRPISA